MLHVSWNLQFFFWGEFFLESALYDVPIVKPPLRDNSSGALMFEKSLQKFPLGSFYGRWNMIMWPIFKTCAELTFEFVYMDTIFSHSQSAWSFTEGHLHHYWHPLLNVFSCDSILCYGASARPLILICHWQQCLWLLWVEEAGINQYDSGHLNQEAWDAFHQQIHNYNPQWQCSQRDMYDWFKPINHSDMRSLQEHDALR